MSVCKALFGVVCFLLAIPVHAQHSRSRPFSFGAYEAQGLSTRPEGYGREWLLAGQVGIYGEWARYALRPGLDLRLTGAADPGFTLAGGSTPRTESAKLVGPRLEYARGRLHPYVEALFGSAHQGNVQLGNGYFVSVDGVMRRGVAGLDLDVDPLVQLRLFEYSAGSMHATNAVFQQSVTVGLVLRFPAVHPR